MMSEARNGTLVLTEQGKPIAALVAIEGMDAESLALATNARFLKILQRSFRELDKGRRISLVEMRRRVG
jgi:antitoxin (DNA-binding transcriptional repressor) of toxin-antitoxin stability system